MGGNSGGLFILYGRDNTFWIFCNQVMRVCIYF